jgi:hypothetical protein
VRLYFLSAALLVVVAGCGNEGAGIPLVLQSHRFKPSEIHVRANQPALIILANHDNVAEEFDSAALKVEKVVPGNQTGSVRIRPLAPGRYPFMGEYHADTARGVVIAD